MIIKALFCLFFAVLLSVLNAVSVGDLVRLNGLVDNPSLNGMFGIVKAIGEESHEIKVFMSDEILIPTDLSNNDASAFFKTFPLKPENLLSIQSDDHREVEAMSEGMKIQYQSAKLRLEQVLMQSPEVDFEENKKIIMAWMNHYFGISDLSVSPNSSLFKYGAVVFVEGLVSRPEFNGHIGVVMNRGPERTEVLIFLPTPETLLKKTHINHETAFKSLLLRDQNMRLFKRSDWKYEKHRDVEELIAEFSQSIRKNSHPHSYTCTMPNSFVNRTLSNDEKTVLRSLKGIIVAMFGDARYPEPENNTDLRIRVALIGAWINLRYGWFGMSYCCEHDNLFVGPIDRMWHGIGDWLC